jgi:hypothetical protein
MSGDTASGPAKLWTGGLDDPAGHDGHDGHGDDSCEPGGAFRAAVRLVIALEQRLSLDEFARTPVLSNMAAFLDQWVPAPEAPDFGG